MMVAFAVAFVTPRWTSLMALAGEVILEAETVVGRVIHALYTIATVLVLRLLFCLVPCWDISPPPVRVVTPMARTWRAFIVPAGLDVLELLALCLLVVSF
jgi:hypothetical protein